MNLDFPLEKKKFNAKDIAKIGLVRIPVSEKSWSDNWGRGLVVRASREDRDLYERVGVIAISSFNVSYWNAEVRQFQII